MDEKALKTSPQQRIIIILVAILLLGSTIATYFFVVMSQNKSTSSSTEVSDDQISQLADQYDSKSEELEAAAEPLGEKYFPIMKQYISEVKAYNENSATEGILATKDLKVGSGRELAEGDTDYFAYYIGWCAGGSVFDSSLVIPTSSDSSSDSTSSSDTTKIADATGLKVPLDPSGGLIEGWEQGIVGAKLGGVRMITMSGDLAYGDSMEICGGYNKPLRFIVLPIERDAEVGRLSDELADLYKQIYMAYYTSGSSE